MESEMVQSWLRKDPLRWLAGMLAGLFAGGVAIYFAMFLAVKGGYESRFPLKSIATLFLGPTATQIDENRVAENAMTNLFSNPTLVGGFAIECFCLFLGLIFSHFVATNRFTALLPMGLVWGVFSWIFIWNLFLPSAQTIYALQVPSASVFFICMLFGISLVSVSFFDRLFKGKSKT